jgi:hypothetical protein
LDSVGEKGELGIGAAAGGEGHSLDRSAGLKGEP